MIHPYAIVLLLFVTTLITTCHSLDAASQNDPRSTNGVVDNGRRTQHLDKNFEACPQVPSLHCRNDSYCTPGTASFGEQHDHLDLQTQEGGYYCVCRPGFIGHECEVEVEDCHADDPSDPLHSCYYGAGCQPNDNGFSCDCGRANEISHPSAAKYAGTMCQHVSTSMCAVSLAGTHAPNHQFCTNHGECFKMVSGGEPHPGCICKPGWSGNHCEIRQDPFAAPRLEGAEQKEKSSPNTVLWSLMVIPMVVGAIVAYKVDGIIKRQRAVEGNEGLVFQGQNGSSLSADDLDADGSGTLGSRTENGDEPLGSPMDDDGAGDGEGWAPETKIV